MAQDGAAAGQASAPAQGRGNPGGKTTPYDQYAGHSPAGAGPGGGPMGLGPALARLAWPVALAAALGMLAVGVMLLVWPKATLTIVAILIGAALIVAGVFRLFDGITAHGQSGGMRAADIVIGLLAIVVGPVLPQAPLADRAGPGPGRRACSGSSTASAISSPQRSAPGVPGRGLRAIGGVFSLAAGLVILFWPGVSLILLLTILGAWLLFYGVVLAVLAFRLRSEGKAGAARPAQPAPA